MSKDFEQAYKELAQTEVPDLWNRIEAGLKEKAAPEKETERLIPEKRAWEITGGKKKKLSGFRRYTGIIAAAVCVAVIVPAAVLIRQSSKGYSGGMMESTEEFSMTEGSVEESAEAGDVNEAVMAADTGGAEESAVPADAGAENDRAMAADAVTDEAAAPAEAGAGNARTESEDETADTGMMDMAAAGMEAESAEDVSESRGSTEAQLAAQKKNQSVQNAPTDGELFERVKISVTELEEYFYKENMSGALCTASILQSMSGIRDGEQVKIYVPSDVPYSLYKDGEFEVDLRYQEEEDYSFVLEKIYR